MVWYELIWFNGLIPKSPVGPLLPHALNDPLRNVQVWRPQDFSGQAAGRPRGNRAGTWCSSVRWRTQTEHFLSHFGVENRVVTKCFLANLSWQCVTRNSENLQHLLAQRSYLADRWPEGPGLVPVAAEFLAAPHYGKASCLADKTMDCCRFCLKPTVINPI